LQTSASGVEGQRGGIDPVRYLSRLVAVAIIYWLAARLSLNLALVNGQVTPIWPPTGIALVTFLILGRRMWPAIALAAFAVNLPIGPSPAGAAIIAVGNTLAPLTASELLRRGRLHLQLDRMRDAIAMIFLGALLGMTISATIGSSVLTISGSVPMDRFATTWAVWWAGDAMGVLLVAPMLLSFLPRPGVRRLGWRGSAELAGLLAGVGVVTFLLFENPYRLEYLVLPLIAIAAWRFRLRGAAPAALIASLIAVWAAVNSEGPFASETLLEKMITLQAFNVSVSGASFLLAAYADLRQQREEIVRRYQAASLAIAAKNSAIDVAAHELGPPVAILTSYLAILYEGKLGPPPTKWLSILRVMDDKAWQIDRIINELVDAARIEATPPTPAQLDLREAVQKAVERASRRLEVSGGKITTTLAPEPVQVAADPRQIGRILDNLINNSLTYTVKPARLKVDAAVEGDRAVIHMVDNGVGISEDERVLVFEPFYRSKDPAFSEIPGVGLGLFASRKLAEVNHGRLVLERSEPGRGSTFALDLPLAKSERVRADA
jgi:signal transduction histidine kinase